MKQDGYDITYDDDYEELYGTKPSQTQKVKSYS